MIELKQKLFAFCWKGRFNANEPFVVWDFLKHCLIFFCVFVSSDSTAPTTHCRFIYIHSPITISRVTPYSYL